MNFQARPRRCRFRGVLADHGKRIALASMLLLSAQGCASAGDWSVNLNTDNRATVYDNFFLERHPRGALFEYTGFTDLNALYKMSDGQLGFTGQLTDHEYAGRRQREATGGLFPHLGGHWKKQGSTTGFDISGFYEYESINPGDSYDSGNGLDGAGLDGGGSSGSGDGLDGGGSSGGLGNLDGSDLASHFTRRHRGNVYAAVDHRFNVRNSLKWSSRYSRIIYDGYGSNNEGYGTGLDYGYRLTKRSKVDFIGDLNWLNTRNDRKTRRLDYGLKTRLSTEVTERLKLNATIGLSLLTTREQRDGSTQQRSKLHGDGNFGIRYKLKTTELGFDAGYGTSQTDAGSLEQRFRAAADYTWNVNDTQDFNINARFDYWKASSSSLDGDSHVLAISPNYSIGLDRNWKAGLGYRFEMRHHHAHTYIGNSAWVSLSRNFVLHP